MNQQVFVKENVIGMLILEIIKKREDKLNNEIIFPYIPGEIPLANKTLPPHLLHHGQYLHKDINNLYGIMDPYYTYQAQKALGKVQPFQISRSTFPGTGQYAQQLAFIYPFFLEIIIMLYRNHKNSDFMLFNLLKKIYIVPQLNQPEYIVEFKVEKLIHWQQKTKTSNLEYLWSIYGIIQIKRLSIMINCVQRNKQFLQTFKSNLCKSLYGNQKSQL